MTQRSCDTLTAAVVESHHAAVAQRQLQFALTLLARNLARYRTVHFVSEPVLASHRLQLEHVVEIFVEMTRLVGGIFVVAHNRLVHHDRLRRMAKHLCHIEIERTNAVSLHKTEMSIARSLAHHIHWCAFAFRNLAHMVEVFLVDEEAHALLALVGDDFFSRECCVANGEFRHVDLSATFLYQFGETVHMTCRTVVVDRNNGVHLLFAKRTDKVVGALLHFGISSLNGVEFYTGGIATRINGADTTAAQTDAIIVATDNYHLIAFFRRAFEAISFGAVAHTSGQHNHFVVAIFLIVFLMLKSKHRTRNQRLAEFVSKVGSTIRSLDENLFGRLIEPLAHGEHILPGATAIQARVGRHINSRTSYRPRANATAHTVADFSTRSCGSTIEGFHGCGEVVRFGLERDDTLNVANDEIIARRMVCWCKLFHNRTLGKRHVVLVGRNNLMRIFLCCLFDEIEER